MMVMMFMMLMIVMLVLLLLLVLLLSVLVVLVVAVVRNIQLILTRKDVVIPPQSSSCSILTSGGNREHHSSTVAFIAHMVEPEMISPLSTANAKARTVEPKVCRFNRTRKSIGSWPAREQRPVQARGYDDVCDDDGTCTVNPP